MGKKKCKPDNNELLFRAKKKDYNKIRSLMNREGEEGASSVTSEHTAPQTFIPLTTAAATPSASLQFSKMPIYMILAMFSFLFLIIFIVFFMAIIYFASKTAIIIGLLVFLLIIIFVAIVWIYYCFFKNGLNNWAIY